MKRSANKNFQCRNETQEIRQKKKRERARGRVRGRRSILDFHFLSHCGMRQCSSYTLFVVAITTAIVDSIQAKMSTLSTFISPIDWVIASGRWCYSASTSSSSSPPPPPSMSSPSPITSFVHSSVHK